MCDPVSITTATLGVLSAYGQQSAAEANAAAQDNAYKQNRINALASMREDYKQVGTRQIQEADAAAQRTQERQAQARREEASARVGAGEAGITGISVEGILRDIAGLSLQDTDAINQGSDWNINQLQAEKSGISTATQGRISSQSKGSAPSKWSMGLGIATAGVNSYSGYMNRTGKDPLGDAFK